MFKAIKEWFLNTWLGKWLFPEKALVPLKRYEIPGNIFEDNQLDYNVAKKMHVVTKTPENSNQLKTSSLMFLYKTILGIVAGKPVDINFGDRKARYLAYSAEVKPTFEAKKTWGFMDIHLAQYKAAHDRTLKGALENKAIEIISKLFKK